jgi:hypothetical protein
MAPFDAGGAKGRPPRKGKAHPVNNDARYADPGVSRQIVRRATMYSLGFFAAALFIALAGAALVAWLFSRGTLPFFETWLVITAVIVLPGLAATAWKLIRGR